MKNISLWIISIFFIAFISLSLRAEQEDWEKNIGRVRRQLLVIDKNYLDDLQNSLNLEIESIPSNQGLKKLIEMKMELISSEIALAKQNIEAALDEKLSAPTLEEKRLNLLKKAQDNLHNSYEEVKKLKIEILNILSEKEITELKWHTVGHLFGNIDSILKKVIKELSPY